LRGQREQNILPHKSFHIDPRSVEEVHIEFVARQFVLLHHFPDERATVLYLKLLIDREGKKLETPTAMELKVRGDLPPHKNPGWVPVEMQRGLDRPEKMNPLPGGVQKVLSLAKLDVQTLCRDLSDVDKHPASPHKSANYTGPTHRCQAKNRPHPMDKPAT
jgi:hypothetical protein